MPDPAPWEVWVVPFPYADRLAEKRRPALVVSSDALFRDHGLVWVAMITSTRINGWNSDVEISEIGTTGLRIPSRIRLAKIATVEPSRLLARLGRIGPADVQAVAAGLVRFLAPVEPARVRAEPLPGPRSR